MITTKSNKRRDQKNDVAHNQLAKAFGQHTPTQFPASADGLTARIVGVNTVDHLNIYRTTNELSSFLNIWSLSPKWGFRHSHFGEFRTIYGFQLWIIDVNRPGDEHLRKYFGEQLSEFAKTLTTTEIGINRRAILLDAIYQRLSQHPSMVKQLIAWDKPFELYHLNRVDIPIRHKEYSWLISGISKIRQCFIDKAPFDPTPWIRYPNTWLFTGRVDDKFKDTILSIPSARIAAAPVKKVSSTSKQIPKKHYVKKEEVSSETLVPKMELIYPTPISLNTYEIGIANSESVSELTEEVTTVVDDEYRREFLSLLSQEAEVLEKHNVEIVTVDDVKSEVSESTEKVLSLTLDLNVTE